MEELQLEQKLEPLVREAGLLLVDMSLARAGKRLMLRILVDRKDRVTIREIGVLSRRIKDLLDGELILGNDSYRLEVSSPGVGRRLESDVDWERTVGRTLTLQLEDDSYTGRLTGRDGDSLLFDDTVRIELSKIIRAVEVLEDRPQSTGHTDRGE